ncbi:MAG TPA: PEP/pyruvate-binding domain-containing protein [Steroidobacteraceae bacterium]
MTLSQASLVFPITAPAALLPERVGPKAANLAALGRAGLPIPEGFCIEADAYWIQLAALGLDLTIPRGRDDVDVMRARRQAIAVRLALSARPIVNQILEPLLGAWQLLRESTGGVPLAVRSSSLVEDRHGSSCAGQFESYLGLDSQADFLTAVRACWASLWSPRMLRYLQGQGASPADTAMAVLVQPLIDARASGGGLSRTAAGSMLLSATSGLGSAIAQGEVVPDRYDVARDGTLIGVTAGSGRHAAGCHQHSADAVSPPGGRDLRSPCLSVERVQELAGYLAGAERIMGRAVEIEWALDATGFKLLQSRPLSLQQGAAPDPAWSQHPRARGQPAGVGWGTGRACVVTCECELSRVGPGDVLITRIAGPALGRILARVAGVVTELGGSTSHLASLARERGIPMVLGVRDATQRIPDGRQVAVDGVAGVVRWIN